jgi:outer membrane receptor protein involved in Fe transport
MAETNAAAGLIYQDGGLYSSITAKYLGKYYSGNADAAGNNIFLGGYTITNFNLSYKFDGGYKAGFAVNNLFNTTGQIASPASDASGNPLFFVMPTRSYQVNFSVPF